MIIYDNSFIDNIISNNKDSGQKLDSTIESYLFSLLCDINDGKYTLTPNFTSTYPQTNQKYKKSNSKYNKYKKHQNYENDNEIVNATYNSNNSNNSIKDDKNIKIETKDNNEILINNKSLYINEKIDNSVRVNRLKVINNKTDSELAKSNIKKILNKITHKTYTKLTTELLCYYTSLKLELSEDNLLCINEYIFNNIVYYNKIHSDIYCHLFIKLIANNETFHNNLNTITIIFYNIFDYIKISNIVNADEIIENNKNNDKYKCLCEFILNCFKKNIIEYDVINTGLENLYNELYNNIIIENKKSYCEEISDIIFIIVSSIYNNIEIIKNNDIKNNDIINKYNNIYNKCSYISSLKANTYPSISNKIIFKHKDINEKFRLTNNPNNIY
tara:strand:+ start:2987 stop:4147 length:1161 start_codon:yes stop_codon:yes gene_type:complete